MAPHKIFLGLVGPITFCLLLASANMVVGQATNFTYQGRLQDGGTNANGTYDFEFALYDALSAGSQVGPTAARNSILVANGIFTVTLDFGSAFPGAERFIEVRVRQSGGGSFNTLAPRQQVNSTPYSIKSLIAENASTATNAAQLAGIAASQYVLTGDARLSDARNPLPGSSDYIQNQNTGPQATSNFNISGNGTVGGLVSANVVNAAARYEIGGTRILSAPGTTAMYVGRGAGLNSTGSGNSFFGSQAGAANTTGSFNSFFGYESGQANTTGFNNAFFASGRVNTTGRNNAFFGVGAAATNTTGMQNSYFGFSAGAAGTSASDNAFFGISSGGGTTTGNSNSFFGSRSGLSNTLGNNNSYFGVLAQGSPALFNATALGANAYVSQDNSIVLGSINNVNGAIADTNVGIGTTAPTERLHVVGNGLITGNLTVNGNLNLPSFAGQFIQNAVTQQPNSNFNISGNGIVGGTLSVGNAGTSARLYLNRASPTAANSADINFYSAGQPDFAMGTSQGSAAPSDFSIYNYGTGSNAITIKRSNSFIGIGTPSPDSDLHLRSASTTGFAIQMENTSSAKRLYIGNYGTTGGGNHWPGLDSANTSFLYAQNPLVFTTPGGIYFSGSTAAEHMRISTNGNVGIGAVNPTEPLVVSRNFGSSTAFAIENTSSGSSQKLLLSNYGVTGAGNYWPGLDSANTSSLLAPNPFVLRSSNGLIFSGSNTAEHMRITPNGGVLINNTNPSTPSRLHVHGGVHVSGAPISVGNVTVADTFSACWQLDNLLGYFLGKCSSSLRYKTAIRPFAGGLKIINQLRPITFNWTQDGTPDIGLGAEDVEKIEPVLVTYEKDHQVDGVKYDRIGVVLINAIKEQQAQINQQQDQLKQQRALIEQQAVIINNLRRLVCRRNGRAAICRQ